MYLKNELLLTKHLPLISTILRNKVKKKDANRITQS